MNPIELKFCEQYETKLREFKLLDAIRNNLTQKGMKIYYSLKKWIDENTNRYLTITGR